MNKNQAGVGPSALLSFRAENVRSFRDEIEFSLLATSMAEREYAREIPWREGGSPLRVLATAGVFGANASGKSNLLEAMDDMRLHVLRSFRAGEPGGRIGRWPFRLNEDAPHRPSRYEVEVVLAGVLHEYGYVINDDRVLEEWAYRRPKGRSALLFRRAGDTVEFGAIDRTRARAARDLLRSNALYLSTAAAGAHPQLTPLWEWFARNMLYAEASSRPERQLLTTEMLDDDRQRLAVLELLWAADLGIVDAKKRVADSATQERLQRAVRILAGDEDQPPDSNGSEVAELASVSLMHGDPDAAVEFKASEESLGTMVWFGLVGPVLRALASGSVLLVDELDASLHPDLVRRIVGLFQRRKTNPKLAQLVFNSHDPALMGDSTAQRLLGRDQVWFTEKLNDGSSHLYPLARLGPRKHEAVTKRYMEGRYGARPILMDGALTEAVAEFASESL